MHPGTGSQVSPVTVSSHHPLQGNQKVVPPAEVVNQLQGRSKSDINTFLGTGYRDVVHYLSQMAHNGGDVPGMHRMLDFGIGTARNA